ncbi:hypothetical protein NDU88_006268 [Pleurodeles waltl]|uniref:Reverse transcriptase/retrotransposon-derived protein RNase H-like domain-containing protein n=1 Tax=Pleurodeles waltl TaxID=8319 RepID=A0AAV7SPB0_PLEWA|nr:hypothetical protein NDU88_006268 [Pleurodeles waltl]
MGEHNATLHLVLRKLEEFVLTLNQEKCIFLAEQVEYLGYTVAMGSIKPKRSLLDAISKAPVPKDIDQLRSFLELVEYYAKFVEKFTEKTEGLKKCCSRAISLSGRKNSNFVSTTFKREICQAGILTVFDRSLKSALTVDASASGLGVVLSQFHGSDEDRGVCLSYSDNG